MRVKVTYTPHMKFHQFRHAGPKLKVTIFAVKCPTVIHTGRTCSTLNTVRLANICFAERENCTVNDFCSRYPVVGDTLTVLWYKVPAVV